MKTVAPDGEQIELLPAGQKIAISAENATATVSEVLPRNRLQQLARFTDSAQEIGPFALDKRIQIKAKKNLVRYLMDIDPAIVCRKDDKIGVGILDPVAEVDVDGDIAATGGGGGGAVDSVFTRTGAVVAANGDYTASQVTNVPAGTVAAVTVQGAIDELDSEKLSTVDLAADVSGVLPLVNGGAGGIANNRIPFGLGSVFSSSSNFTYNGNDLGVGGSAFYRIESVTNHSNDGIRVRTTSGSHNAFVWIDAHGASQFFADRGSSAYEASVQYKTANVVKWTAGILGGATGYSVKNPSRTQPDIFVQESDGRVGVGTNLPLAELHVLKSNATVRVDNSGAGGRALLNVRSTAAGGDAGIESERYSSGSDSYFGLRTALSGADWYAGHFSAPAALNTAFGFKTSTAGNPILNITKNGRVAIGASALVPDSVLHVRGGGALVGSTPTGGDKGAGTVNTSKGVYTNGANGSHRGTRVVNADANASILISDSVVIIDVTAFTANRTVIIDTDVFQDAFGTTGGREVTIINTGTSAFTLTLDFEGSQTIYGGGGFVIPTATSDTILCTNPGGVSGQGTAYQVSRYSD